MEDNGKGLHATGGESSGAFPAFFAPGDDAGITGENGTNASLLNATYPHLTDSEYYMLLLSRYSEQHCE